MGMFDTIHCDYPLENRPEWAETFQTKDLDCLMQAYKITADGELLKMAYGEIEWRFHPYRGAVNFYDYDSASTGWIEYSALFDEGKLLSVKMIHDGSPMKKEVPDE